MTKKYTSLEHLIKQIVTEGGVGFGTKGGDKAKGTSGAFYNSYSSKHGGHSSAMARVAAKDSGKENIKMEEAEEDKSNQASIDRIQRAADAIRAMTKSTTPVKLPNVDEFDLDQLKTGMKKTVKEDGAVPNEGNATPTSKAYGSFDEDGKKKLKEEKIVVKPKPTEKVTEKPEVKGKKPAGEEDIVYPDGPNKPKEEPTQEKPKETEKPEEKPKENPEEAKKSKLSKAAGFAAGLLGGSSGGSTDGVQDWQYLSPGSIGTSAGSKFPLRKTVKEEAEGTILRRNIENVARPKFALSPFDRKSKLAKQAEIKTKIIDEEKKLGGVIRKAVSEKKTREEKESSISDGKTKVVDNVIFNPPLNKVNVNEGNKKTEYEDSDESVPKTNFPYYKSMQAPPGEPQGGYDKQKNDNLTDFGKAAGAAGAASGAVGAAKYAKDVLTKPVSTTRGEIGSAKAGGKLGALIGVGQELLDPSKDKADAVKNIAQSTVAGAAGSTMPGMLLDPDLSIPYPNLNAKNWDEFKKEPLKSLTIQKGSLNDGEQEAHNKLIAKAHKSGFTPPGFASKEHYDQYKKEHGPIGFSISKGEYVLPKNAPHPKNYSDSISKGK